MPSASSSATATRTRSIWRKARFSASCAGWRRRGWNSGQAFLDSPYCPRVEIGQFLAREVVIFPVILSACEWKRHEWLRSRQFLPGGEKTVEENYRGVGKRKRLFLEVREGLRRQVERLRGAAPAGPGSDACGHAG